MSSRPDAEPIEVAFYPDETWDTEFVEFLWCERDAESGAYEVLTIPCYANGISLGDLILIEDDPEPHFGSLLRPSGHSTIRVALAEAVRAGEFSQPLLALNAEFVPRDGDREWIIDLPPNTAMASVLDHLVRAQEAGKCGWTVGAISSIHGAELRAAMDPATLPSWVPRA